MLCENILSALQISNQLGGSRKKVLIPEKTFGIDGAANNLCVAN